MKIALNVVIVVSANVEFYRLCNGLQACDLMPCLCRDFATIFAISVQIFCISLPFLALIFYWPTYWVCFVCWCALQENGGCEGINDVQAGGTLANNAADHSLTESSVSLGETCHVCHQPLLGLLRQAYLCHSTIHRSIIHWLLWKVTRQLKRTKPVNRDIGGLGLGNEVKDRLGIRVLD